MRQLIVLAALATLGCPRATRPSESTEGAMASLERGGKPVSSLSLPATEGQVATDVTGCAAPGASQSPTRSMGGGGGADSITVEPQAGGVRVTHVATHMCCLTVKVDVETRPGFATFTERFTGEGCRCQCGSTVTSLARVPAGATAVRVVMSTPSGDREVYSGMVSVP